MDAQDIKHFSVNLRYCQASGLALLLAEIFEYLDGSPFPVELLPPFLEVYRQHEPQLQGGTAGGGDYGYSE